MRSSQWLVSTSLAILSISAQAAVDLSNIQVSSGQFTPVQQANTVTFDSPIPGDIHYTGGSIVIGSDNNHAAPAYDTTHYLRSACCGDGTVVTFDAGVGATYFGFYLGSSDPDNYLTVRSSDGSVKDFGYGELISYRPAGAPDNSFYLGLLSTPGSVFTQITFYGGNVMETDNHAYMLAAAVPEPETYAMLLAGIGLLAGIVSRRGAK